MLLKSFGCSFIFGSDLVNNKQTKTFAVPSYQTWPALLAQSLSYDYVCYAQPGSGNLQILETLLNELAHDNPAIYVIGWSWIDRFDYISTDDESWATIMPSDSTSLAQTYYRNLHSQYKDKLNTLMYIKLAIDSLNQKKCPFIMTYIDDLIFETKWHSSPAISDLQKYVEPYLTNFEGQTFLNWSKKKGFPISETLHPLEQAHEEAFKLLYKQNTIDR